jgi:hypothetical protein
VSFLEAPASPASASSKEKEYNEMKNDMKNFVLSFLSFYTYLVGALYNCIKNTIARNISCRKRREFPSFEEGILLENFETSGISIF